MLRGISDKAQLQARNHVFTSPLQLITLSQKRKPFSTDCQELCSQTLASISCQDVNVPNITSHFIPKIKQIQVSLNEDRGVHICQSSVCSQQCCISLYKKSSLFHTQSRSLHTKYNSNVTSNFQTKYNTRPDGGLYEESQPNNNSQSNISYKNSATDGNTKIFVSKHTKLDRQETVGYLNRKHLGYREQSDKVLVKDCPFCKPTHNRVDNQYKLAVFDTGGINCMRCGTSGSFYDLKRQLGDIPQISDLSGSPISPPRAKSGEGTFHRQSNSRDASISGFSSSTSPISPANISIGGDFDRFDKDEASRAPQLNQESTEKYSRELGKYPEVLSYLTGSGPGQRGLRREVVEFYKVGVKIHSFPSASSTASNITWVQHPCITFPWTRLSVINACEPPPIFSKPEADIVEDNVKEAVLKTTDTSKWSPPSVIYDRIKLRSVIEKHQQRLLPAGGEWGLFGWHTIPLEAQTLVITEGEFDAMAVYQSTGLPAVSLPNGASSLPIQLLPCLERFTKIILWMDADKAGQDGAQAFVQKLGVQRCTVVDPDADQFPMPPTADELQQESLTGIPVPRRAPKDANDALRAGLNLLEIIDSAAPCSHKQIASFRSFRGEVKRMFTEPKTHEGVLMPAMPQLMALMKGHRRGELTIITGSTGVGKTTILSQLSLEVCSQGVPTLWGSFEIRNPRLARTMMLQYAAREGIPLTMNNHVNFDIVADRFQRIPMHFLRFYGSSPVEEVLDAMDYAVYVHDVQHVILDNLQFMLSGQGGRHSGDKFDIQDKAIEAFRQFASQRNVHVTLVIHPRKEADNSSLGLSSVFGSAKATQEADNVLIIQAGLPKTITRTLGIDKGKKPTTARPDLSQHGGFDDPITGEIVNTYFRTLELRKNRWDGDQGAVAMRFDKATLRLYELTKADIDTGLMSFIEKQRQYKQLDLLRHMSQIDQGQKVDGFQNLPVDTSIGASKVTATGKVYRSPATSAGTSANSSASTTFEKQPIVVAASSAQVADSANRLHEPSIDFILE